MFRIMGEYNLNLKLNIDSKSVSNLLTESIT